MHHAYIHHIKCSVLYILQLYGPKSSYTTCRWWQKHPSIHNHHRKIRKKITWKISDFAIHLHFQHFTFHSDFWLLAPRGVKARRGNGSMNQTPSQREIKVNLVSWIRFWCFDRTGMIDAGNAATYGAINAAPTISTLTLLSGRHEIFGKESLITMERYWNRLMIETYAWWCFCAESLKALRTPWENAMCSNCLSISVQGPSSKSVGSVFFRDTHDTDKSQEFGTGVESSSG